MAGLGPIRLPRQWSNRVKPSVLHAISLTREEIRDGLWIVGVFERWGSMTAEEAGEWRRRILARQRFLDISDTDPPAA